MIPKFRAWEKNMNAMIPVENIDFLAKQINTNSVWRMFHEIELMQSTGLKDKSGVEIYEGDIVTWSTEDRRDRFIVEYVGGGYKCPYHWLFKWEHTEVIGNIYENPELLGENNDCN